MKKLKTLTLSLAAITMIGFSGCGSSSSSSSKTDIEVERGAVYQAIVKDATGKTATPKGDYSNTYTFSSKPKYPITVSGGYIDVDGDGAITTSDIALDINMTSYSNVVTPITTYLGNTTTTEGKARLEKLTNDLNISKEELFKVPSKANSKSIILANAIYEHAIKQSKGMDKLDFADVNTSYKLLETTYNQSFAGKSGKELAIAMENEVVNTDLSSYITKLDANALSQLQAKLAAKHGKSTTSSSSSNPYSNYSYVVIINNINSTSADSITNAWKNYSDFSSVSNTKNTTCSSLGFKGTPTTTTMSDIQIKTYNTDNQKFCSEYDYSNVANIKGDSSIIATYNIKQ